MTKPAPERRDGRRFAILADGCAARRAPAAERHAASWLPLPRPSLSPPRRARPPSTTRPSPRRPASASARCASPRSSSCATPAATRNVFLDPTNPLADTSIVVRGTVEGFVPVRRRVRLFGEGWLDWSYYRSLSTERSTDPGGEGRAEVDLGPFTLTGGGGALQARQLYSIDIDERILRQERWGNGGAEWRITRRFLALGRRRAPHLPLRPERPHLERQPLRRREPQPQQPHRHPRGALQAHVHDHGDRHRRRHRGRVPALGPGPRAPRAPTATWRGVELGEKAFVTGRFLAGMRNFPAASSGSLPSYRGPAYTGRARPAALQPPAPRRPRSCATSTSPPRPSAPPRSAPATPTS